MPQLAAAALAAAASYGAGAFAASIGFSALASQIIGAVVGLVVATGLSLLMGRPKPSATAQAQDRFQTARSGVAPRQVVYGQAMVTGPIVYMASAGTYKEVITVVVPVAGHAIQGYDAIWVNNYRIPIGVYCSGAGDGTTGSGVGGTAGLNAYAYAHIPKNIGDSASLDGSYVIQSGGTVPAYNAGDGVVQLWLWDGTQSAADAQIIADSGGEWTTDHKLLGVAYIHARITFSKDVFPGGLQSISAEIRGKADIYDPRDASTGYSNNPALCIRDYLAADFGLSIPSTEFDDDYWIAAANICDEDVATNLAGTETQLRYTLDGSFKLDTRPADIVESLLTSCAGTVTYVQGLYRLYVGAYDAPSVAITEDDFAGRISVTTSRPRRDQVNTISGTYVEPDQNWSAVAFPQVVYAAAVTADGETIEASVNYPYTIDATRVQRLARLHLLLARSSQVSFDAVFKYGMLRMAIWDTAAVTIADFGWSSQVFRCVAWSYDPTTGLVTAKMQMEDSAAYTWTYSDAAAPILSPTTSLESPLTLAAYSTPTITAGTETNEDGTVVPKLDVTWTQAATPYTTATEVQWRRRSRWIINGALTIGYRPYRAISQDTDWSSATVEFPGTSYTIKPTLPGVAYDVRIRVIAGQVRGAWTTTAASSGGKTVGPSNPSGVSVTAIVGGYSVAWTRPSDYDLAGIAVYEDLGAGKVYVGESNGSGHVVKTGQGDFTARTVYVVARNTTGYYAGDTKAVASASYVNAGSVTPLQARTADIQANAVTSITSISSTTDRANSSASWEDVLTLGTITASAGDVITLLWQANVSIYDNGSGSVVSGSGSEMNGTDNG